jgi:hypothetical protein
MVKTDVRIMDNVGATRGTPKSAAFWGPRLRSTCCQANAVRNPGDDEGRPYRSKPTMPDPVPDDPDLASQSAAVPPPPPYPPPWARGRPARSLLP